MYLQNKYWQMKSDRKFLKTPRNQPQFHKQSPIGRQIVTDFLQKQNIHFRESKNPKQMLEKNSIPPSDGIIFFLLISLFLLTGRNF